MFAPRVVIGFGPSAHSSSGRASSQMRYDAAIRSAQFLISIAETSRDQTSPWLSNQTHLFLWGSFRTTPPSAFRRPGASIHTLLAPPFTLVLRLPCPRRARQSKLPSDERGTCSSSFLEGLANQSVGFAKGQRSLPWFCRKTNSSGGSAGRPPVGLSGGPSSVTGPCRRAKP